MTETIKAKVMIKSFANMTDDKRRKAVAKKIAYYDKKLQEWLSYSRKMNHGTWTKADVELIDILIEKENG